MTLEIKNESELAILEDALSDLAESERHTQSMYPGIEELKKSTNQRIRIANLLLERLRVSNV